MSYTPTNWQTGEVITAEKLNKMDNGWGIQNTQLFSETVTTVSVEGFVSGALSYSLPINSDTITVTFNGTDYVCSRITMDHVNYYGGFSEQGPIFSEYPFAIASEDEENVDGNNIYTETAGTYTVAVSGKSAVVSDNFKKAVLKVNDFEIIPGTTTWAEAKAAFEDKKNVYYFLDTGQKVNVITVGYIQDIYRVAGVTVDSNLNVSAVNLQASSEDGILS